VKTHAMPCCRNNADRGVCPKPSHFPTTPSMHHLTSSHRHLTSSSLKKIPRGKALKVRSPGQETWSAVCQRCVKSWWCWRRARSLFVWRVWSGCRRSGLRCGFNLKGLATWGKCIGAVIPYSTYGKNIGVFGRWDGKNRLLDLCDRSG
jgi:hypothetical protein